VSYYCHYCGAVHEGDRCPNCGAPRKTAAVVEPVVVSLENATTEEAQAIVETTLALGKSLTKTFASCKRHEDSSPGNLGTVFAIVIIGIMGTVMFLPLMGQPIFNTPGKVAYVDAMILRQGALPYNGHAWIADYISGENPDLIEAAACDNGYVSFSHAYLCNHTFSIFCQRYDESAVTYYGIFYVEDFTIPPDVESYFLTVNLTW